MFTDILNSLDLQDLIFDILNSDDIDDDTKHFLATQYLLACKLMKVGVFNDEET